MNTKKDENYEHGTFFTGLTYTGILAIILLLFCFVIDYSWFDYNITFLTIAVICILFFISGLKKIDKNKLGYISKFGSLLNFNQPFKQGTYWIFPLWKFEQNLAPDVIQFSESISITERTNDQVPFVLIISYTWKIKDQEAAFKNLNLKIIEAKIESEINKFIKKFNSVEIIATPEITEELITERLSEVSNSIGISILSLISKVNIHEDYQLRKDEIRQKYLELKLRLDELYSNLKYKFEEQGLKTNDIETEKMLIKQLKEMNFSPSEAINYLKVYKNDVKMNENTFSIGNLDFNKAIESVMTFFKK